MVNSATSRRFDLQNFGGCSKPSGRFWMVTLERLVRLESVMMSEIEELLKLVSDK